MALVVHNWGRPIPAEVQPRIFEPFLRVGATNHHDLKRQGLGLGLFIAREVVRAHAGTIQVTSSAEEGTTFTVTLPRASPAQAANTDLD